MNKCVKCGANFVGTPENPPTENRLCKYCEIEQLKADNAKLRKALVGLVDADGAQDLDMMELHILDMTKADGDEPNRRVTLAAIKALRETLPCQPAADLTPCRP
jgi:hypothetical protein